MGSTRRQFLSRVGRAGIGSLAATHFLCIGRSIAEVPADPSKAIEAWMDVWMQRDKALVGPLHVGRFADPIYFLLKPITWKPNPDQLNAAPPVTVPIGFVTDFASIPRIFWSLFRPDGLYTYPAIVHDYLYWTQTTSKDVADRVFRFGMEDIGVEAATITTLFEAVSLGGQSAWDENARLKASGERRVLKNFPEDPRILWGEWKKNPANFK